MLGLVRVMARVSARGLGMALLLAPDLRPVQEYLLGMALLLVLLLALLLTKGSVK